MKFYMRIFTFPFLLVVITCLGLYNISAQNSTVYGTLTDLKTNETLIGAVVTAENSLYGAQSDFEGKFTIENIPAGSYTLSIKLMTYKPISIPLVVEANMTKDLGNIKLESADNELTEVVVTSNRITNTEISVLAEMNKLEQIATGVSAQLIAKTQDKDASQVLRRMSGISIMDNRFAMIRGLNERYNTVILNEAITPSTEVDVRAFSFDLLPASAIDRMIVVKTATAENPGELAGAVIKIHSKSRPLENQIYLGVSTGYTSNVTGISTLKYKGGKLDFLGVDDGTRGLPQGFASRSILNGSNRTIANEQFKRLSPFYSLSDHTIMPDFGANLGIERLFNLGNKKCSNITNLSYSISNGQNQNAIQERYEGVQNNELAYKWIDNGYIQKTNISIMSNFNMIVNEKFKIDFFNLYNQMSSNETLERIGTNYLDDLDFQNYAFRYETRSIYSGQIVMNHEINDRTKLNYNLGYGFTNRYEPDYRRFTTSGDLDVSDQIFQMDVPPVSNPSLTQSARFWSALNEYSTFASANLDHNFKLYNKDLKLKTGFYSEYKIRDFNARWFGYVNPHNSSLVYQSPEIFFDENNLTTNSGGVTMLEGTNFDDKYNTKNTLSAVFVSLLVPISDKLNGSFGFRGEYNHQQLYSRVRGSGSEVNVNNPIFSPLPSLNFSYSINDRHKLRIAYGMTVNRPEFREIAPFSYYDFNLNIAKAGNPELKTASIQNIDLKYEIYHKNGDLFSLAGFYKLITNPIELAGRSAGSGTSFYFTNPSDANLLGAEIDIKKSVNGILKNRLKVAANASYIHSTVNANNLESQISNRPLQGQSPYLVNTSIFYEMEGLQVSLLYNLAGSRIFVTGDNLGNQTIYELARNVIDLNVTKSIGKYVNFKLGIKDLLNQSFRYKADTNSNFKIDAEDKNWRSYKRGTNVTLGLSVKL